MSAQQIFMVGFDMCLLIILIIDFTLLLKNIKRSRNDFNYELTKMELEFKKDLHFCDCLGKLDERIEKLEKLHNIKNEESEEETKDE